MYLSTAAHDAAVQAEEENTIAGMLPTYNVVLVERPVRMGLCGRFALHPNVFVPKLRTGSNERFHQRNSLLQVQDDQLHPTRANVVFWSLECFVLTDDHLGDLIEQHGATAHITGG